MPLQLIKSAGLQLMRRLGYDVVRYPMASYLTRSDIELVIDVGGHYGEYGRELRGWGYRGRIVSFEPQSGPFAALSTCAKADGAWEAQRMALGSHAGQVDIRISGATAASSVLAVQAGPFMEAEALQTQRTETVPLARLDDALTLDDEQRQRALLKIDTQGYELEVLRGAERTLSRCNAVQVELSLTPLYQGAPTIDTVIGWLAERGFEPYWFLNGYKDSNIPRMLQVDGVFFRRGHGPRPARSKRYA